MSGIHTETVGDAHGYTREDTPWILDARPSVCGRLVHYLSGGGMRTFGRTIVQERAKRRHRRFLMVAGALGAVWLVFYFV